MYPQTGRRRSPQTCVPTFTSNAATRRFAFQFLINQGGARTGTVRFSLPQLEQGSAATAWRNAPEDGGAAAAGARVAGRSLHAAETPAY